MRNIFDLLNHHVANKALAVRVTRGAREALIVRDFKRLHKNMAKIGIMIALICHFLPENWKLLCHVAANVCKLGR